MDANYNKSSCEPTESEESTISLDTCEMTPLSPRRMSFDRVDRPTTTGGQVHLVCDDRLHSNMAPVDSPRQQKDGSWQWKISIIVAFTVFSAVLLIAISYAMRYMQCSQEKKENRILDTYKSLFMTKDELNVMMTDMKKQDAIEQFAPVRETPRLPQYNCTLVRPRELGFTDEPRVGASQRSDLIYHGCCATRLTAKMFDHLPDHTGKFWRVVQFMDHSQYFFVDECMHTMHCMLPCTCMRQARKVTALVADENFENERLASVVYAGSCKCINTGNN